MSQKANRIAGPDSSRGGAGQATGYLFSVGKADQAHGRVVSGPDRRVLRGHCERYRAQHHYQKGRYDRDVGRDTERRTCRLLVIQGFLAHLASLSRFGFFDQCGIPGRYGYSGPAGAERYPGSYAGSNDSLHSHCRGAGWRGRCHDNAIVGISGRPLGAHAPPGRRITGILTGPSRWHGSRSHSFHIVSASMNTLSTGRCAAPDGVKSVRRGGRIG